MEVIQKSYSLKLAALDEDRRGTFSGTACPFDVKDAIGDVIRPTCFSKSIAEANGRFPLLWSHVQRDVLGPVDVAVDKGVLKADGELLTDAIAKAREVHELMKVRAVKGLSVGFLPIRAQPMKDGGVEYIEGRLLEVSLCACPSYSGAEVAEVRSLDVLVKALHERGDLIALRNLRSAIDAMLLTGAGDDSGELLAALRSFAPRWR